MPTYYRAQRLTDGEWIEGCLVFSPNLYGTFYIIPFSDVGEMYVRTSDNVALVKMIRVMEKSLKPISDIRATNMNI